MRIFEKKVPMRLFNQLVAEINEMVERHNKMFEHIKDVLKEQTEILEMIVRVLLSLKELYEEVDK